MTDNPTIKRLVVVCVVLFVLAGTFYFSRPVYRNWKQQRFVTQAKTLLAKGDYRGATMSARQAFELNPNNIEACRILAQIAETFRSPLAISWRQRVVELEKDSTQNKLDLARTALLLGDQTHAELALRAVNKEGQATVEFHQMAAMLSIAQNNIAKAEWHYSEAAKLQPDNKLLELNRAVIHLQARDTNVVSDAERRLEKLYDDPTYRKDALRHLVMAAIRNQEFARAETFAKELESDPKASLEDRLLYLSALQAGENEAFPTYLANLKQNVATNADSINAVNSWLLSHRMADDAMNWLQQLPAEMQSQSSVRVAFVETYAVRRDWPGLQTFLDGQNWDELEFVRLAYAARASRELKEEISSQAQWGAAMRAAGDRLKPLSALVRLVGAWGWDKEKEDALWAIVQRYPGERWALESLNRLYLANGNTHGLYKLYSKLVSYDASNAVAKNNLAALSLLLKIQVEKAHALAREGYLAYSNNEAIVSTYAYSLHLQGRTDEALKTIETLGPKRLESPNIALYYGTILASTEQREKARKYLDIAEHGQPLPEERTLIEQSKGLL